MDSVVDGADNGERQLLASRDHPYHQRRRKRFCIFTTGFLLLVGAFAGVFIFASLYDGSSSKRQILWLSDLHYSSPLFCSDSFAAQNPNETCTSKFGCYGCDTTEGMLQAVVEATSALKATAGSRNSPQSVQQATQLGVIDTPYDRLSLSTLMISGDLAGHHPHTCSEHASLINESISTVLKVSDAYDHLPVAMAIGNDDCYPDYGCPLYGSEGNTTCGTLGALWNMWQRVVGRSNLVPFEENRQTFLKGGYYAVRPATEPKMLFLVLNTNPYSSKYSVPVNSTDPADQLAWLRTQLENATDNADTAYIVGHIPPELSAYVDQNTGGMHVSAMWNAKYLQPFVDIVDEYKKTIALLGFGHTHRNTFRLLTNDTTSEGNDMHFADTADFYSNASDTVANVQNGSDRQTAKRVNYLLQEVAVSPLRFNNPGFRVLHYSQYRGDHSLVGYDQWYTNLADAAGAGKAVFQKLYGFDDYCRAMGIATGSFECRPSLELYETLYSFLSESATTFYDFYSRRTQNYIPNQRTLYCALAAYSTDSDFETCLQGSS